MLISVPVWLTYELSPAVWILLTVALCAIITVVAIAATRIYRVTSTSAADNAACEAIPSTDSSASQDADSPLPPVSVIIYACGHSRTLARLTEAILAQNYPSPFEVIVVNDGADHTVHDSMQRLMLTHPNLYMTFVPDQSRSLSRRKLSLTLGIKAAEYDSVLLTRGNCMVSGPNWLRSMMRHIAEGAEVVVGHAYLSSDSDKPVDRLTAFDEAWQAVTYLPRAINGRPFRATGCNLAYARHLFFDHKGFSNSLHIKTGDDDMFINDIARGRRAAVELSDDSMVRIIEDAPARAHAMQMRERLFADSTLPQRPGLIMGLCSLMLWLWLLASAAAIVLALPSLVPAIGVVLMTAPLLVLIMKWRKAVRLLSHRRLGGTLPLLMLWHPFYHLAHKVSARRHRKENFTWN